MVSKIVRVKLQNLLRKTYLLAIVEQVRYRLKAWSLRSKSKKFVNQNPDFVLPPTHLAYDAYSSPDWDFYKMSGEGTATFLANDIIGKYFDIEKQTLAIYEWGCGPGRVIRHLNPRLSKTVSVYGSDYNSETIEWCVRNISTVSFSLNHLKPPLVHENSKFDFIYCISVFTHLSETTGLLWIDELYRVLKPTGLLLITTAGNNTYDTELLSNEKKAYEEQGIVVRGKYEEGKKMYLTRHSPTYVRQKLLNKFDVIEHSPAGFPFIAQDYWLARIRS